MVVSSFKDLLDAFQLPEVGDWGGVGVMFDFKPTGAHYVELFTEKHFGTYLRNSLIASLGSAAVSVSLGSMAAYALSARSSGASETCSSGSSRPAWRRWWRSWCRST